MTAARKQSRRPRKPDRITNPEPIGNVIDESIYHALRPLDEMVHQVERRWGVDRLRGLVTPELAARFGAAKAKLDAAINDNDPAQVQKRVTVMMKGWRALSYAAEAAGCEEVSADVWEGCAVSGTKYAFCRSGPEAHKAAKDRTDYRVFSVDEVIWLLEIKFEAVGAAKEVFPGATVERVRDAGKIADDSVPF